MSTHNNNFIIPSLALPFISALVLSVESYLETQGSSLCKTEACEAVGSYLRIGESVLVLGGAVFFWLLFLSVFFSYRYPDKLKGLPFVLLLPAIAFDGAIIGCQIFTIQQKCILCLFVAAAIIISSLVYCLSQKTTLLLICCILTWSGGFAASGILTMPEPTQARTQMIFYEQATHPNIAAPRKKEITFLFSMNCPHCFEIISYLAEKNTKKYIWKFAAIDQDYESLQKIAFFIEKSEKTDNIFQLLKNAKLTSPTNKYNIDKLQHHTKKALTYLANSGFNYIPLLVSKESETEEKLFLGTSSIMKYLQSDL